MKGIFKKLFVLAPFLIIGHLSIAQSPADSMFHFIQNHKQNTSLYLIKNDSVIAALNGNEMMPLASTMKILVAIEFAKQGAHELINPEKQVALDELAKYYIPHTDGGAHPAWIQWERRQGNIEEDSLPLLEVAKGMILFSSNANTEYLMDLLGLQNINQNYQLMGIEKYTPLYYLVSSLFIYQNPKQRSEEKIIKQIKKLSQEAYIRATEMIHNQLKNNPDYKNQFRPQDLTAPMQKLWSSKLPASTAKAYTKIAYILNNRNIFNEETYSILSQILETIMQNPQNRKWLDHAGMKGGSTIYALTKMMYATLDNGGQYALSYFFDDLNARQNAQLQGWMNAFEQKILTDEEFRKKLSEMSR